MKIHCIICKKEAVMRGGRVFMRCMCDDDYRILSLSKIKMGCYSDKIYILTDDEETEENICNVV